MEAVQGVIRQLELIRRRARRMLVVQRLAIAIAGALAVVAGLALLDFIFRTPSTWRTLQWFVLIGAAGAMAWRYLWPAISFSPALVTLALRLEERLPPLKGYLASGVEFALVGADRESALAAQSIAEAERRAALENFASQFQPRRVAIDVGLAALAILMVGVAFAASPSLATVGAQRILTPWRDVHWPKRTGVENATEVAVHPLGRALPLRASVTKGFSPDMTVAAEYREWRDGQWGPWERVWLTPQKDRTFERLVEPTGERLEVFFLTEDDRTDVHAIRLVPAPEVVSAVLTATPPAYASGVIEPMRVDLGTGVDERAVAPQPLLRGSGASLVVTFNKPLPTPADGDFSPWIDWQAEAGEPTVEPRSAGEASSEWLISWTVQSPVRLGLRLIDEHGIEGPEDLAFRIDARDDRPPTASLLEPATDQSVLATAVLDVTVEARDDVQLSALSLGVAHERAEAPAPADRPAEPIPWARRETDEADARLSTELELSRLDPEPGDVIELTAAAMDRFELDGVRHDPQRSTPRRLRVISPAQFVEEVHRDLAVVRDRAIGLDADQAELAQRGGADEAARREQAEVGQRVARLRESVEAVRERVGVNRLDDASIASVLEEAGERLNEAGAASNEAAERLTEAGRAPEGSEERAQAEQRAAAAQARVRDELARLIAQLDRGEDSWVMRRRIEQLRQAQAETAREADRMSAQTRGRTLEELSRSEREALERLAEDQRDLARQAEELIADLERQAEASRESKPDLASTMEQAAREARRRGLDHAMRQASEQLSRNQGQRASESQQSAVNALDAMLERIEQAERARVERLKRELDDLAQSLATLIRDQESQLDALAEARAAGELQGLDQGMIRLNQNTAAVLEQALAGGRELERVASLVEEASEAQGQAIRALRRRPVDDAAAEEHEQRSLARLREAHELAERLRQQAQADENRRKRAELMRAYLDIHQRQEALRGRTEPLTDDDRLDRRERIEARELAGEQEILRQEAATLLEQTEELGEALVFRAVHEEIDAAAGTIVDDLRRGDVGPDLVMRQQDLADRLLALAEALRQDPNASEFQQEQPGGGSGGGSGGGGQQPLIPPIAQLKLLRGVQESIYRSTRALDESPVLDDEVRAERAAGLGEAQQKVTDLARDLIQQMQQPPGISIEQPDEPSPEQDQGGEE